MDRRRQNFLGLVRAAGLDPDQLEQADADMFTQIAGFDQAAVDDLVAKLSNGGQAYGRIVRRVMNVRDKPSGENSGVARMPRG